MRILGVVSDAKAIRWVLIEGSRDKPQRVYLSSERLGIPEDRDKPLGPFLVKCKSVFDALLTENSVEKVVLERAIGSKHSQPLAARVKFEGLLEFICQSRGIPSALVSIKGTTTKRRHFETHTESTLTKVLNAGKAFKPKALETAAILAWCEFD